MGSVRELTYRKTAQIAWDSLNDLDQEDVGDIIGVPGGTDFEFQSDEGQDKITDFFRSVATDPGDVSALNRQLEQIGTGDVVDTPSGPGRVDRQLIPCPVGEFPGEVGFLVALQTGEREIFCARDVSLKMANRAPTGRQVIEGILSGVPVDEAVRQGIHSIQTGRRVRSEARYRALIAEVEHQGDVDHNISALQQAGATNVQIVSTDFQDESTVLEFEHPNPNLTASDLEQHGVIADLLVKTAESVEHERFARGQGYASEQQVKGNWIFFSLRSGTQDGADDEMADIISEFESRGFNPTQNWEAVADPQERGEFDGGMEFSSPDEAQRAADILDDVHDTVR